MVDTVMFSSASEEWGTPDDFVRGLEAIWGRFDLDVCAKKQEYAKAPRFFSSEDVPGSSGVDGLAQLWEGNVFCNPPWTKASPVTPWIDKAIASVKTARTVMLVPSRTDTKWFAKLAQHASFIAFVRGRLKYVRLEGAGASSSATFPSVVALFEDFERPEMRRGVGFISNKGEVVI